VLFPCPSDGALYALDVFVVLLLFPVVFEPCANMFVVTPNARIDIADTAIRTVIKFFTIGNKPIRCI
jgi:hypothetical protein